MNCERCGNADADEECRACGFVFCAGCVNLQDREPICWECLGVDQDEDEDEDEDEED